MTPEQLIPKMEGMVGYMLGSADGGSIQGSSVVTEWLRLVKEMLKGPNFRYLTDLEFRLFNDIDEGAAVDGIDGEASATHLIAALIEITVAITTDGHGWVEFAQVPTLNTGIGGGTVADTHLSTISVVDPTTTGASEFYPVIWMAGAADGENYSTTGYNLGTTGFGIGFEGNTAGAPAADTCRVWCLYRT